MRGTHWLRSGQTVVETMIVLPLFFILVFGLLQLGQLAVTLITVNYAAGSLARQAVEQGIQSGSSSNLDARLHNLMFGGMVDAPVQVGPPTGTHSSNSVTQDVQVDACAQISAFPLVGQFLSAAIKSRLAITGACDPASGPISFGPQGGRFVFVVKGTARARMNYTPR